MKTYAIEISDLKKRYEAGFEHKGIDSKLKSDLFCNACPKMCRQNRQTIVFLLLNSE